MAEHQYLCIHFDFVEPVSRYKIAVIKGEDWGLGFFFFFNRLALWKFLDVLII